MDRNNLIAVALGEQPADLVVVEGQLVNVFSGEIYPSGIAVKQNRIAAVGDVNYCIGPNTIVVEAKGRYLVPGFIECHMHFGATSLVMTEFARLVVPFGTAGIVIDFTEAGKMQGVMPMRFFLDETNNTPLKAYFSPFWTTILGTEGHSPLTLEEFEEILSWSECVELREWNIQTERHPSPEVRQLGVIARKKNLILSGHMRAQKGKTLQASVATGSISDHEAKSREEALDRIRLGVAVQMRFGSAHLYEMQEMLKAVTQDKVDPRLFMFSTDEQDIDDIAKLGHLDDRIRIAISMGVPPIEAIRMGSLNPASFLGKTDEIGSLTPGRIAFINLVDDLRSFHISNVVYGDGVVAQDGNYVGKLTKPEYPKSFFNSINIPSKLNSENFRIPVDSQRQKVIARVIGRIQNSAETEERLLELPVINGELTQNLDLDIAKISIIERHHNTGKTGNALYQGLGLKHGAVGTSYHLGPCNLAIVGMNDDDMAIVGNRIAEIGGGFVAVVDGEILAEVPLPILGIVTDEPAEKVTTRFHHIKNILMNMGMGLDVIGMYTMFAILFIPGVAPRLRISPDGLLRIELLEEKLVVTQVPVIVENE